MKRFNTSKLANMRSSCILQLMVSLAILFVQLTSAFHVSIHPKASDSALHAWSLPHENSFTFRTWYNEYNPTARVMVYNDPDPLERYTFVIGGSDWPSISESSTAQPIHKRYINPIKRAWRRRTLRRILAAAARRSNSAAKKN